MVGLEQSPAYRLLQHAWASGQRDGRELWRGRTAATVGVSWRAGAPGGAEGHPAALCGNSALGGSVSERDDNAVRGVTRLGAGWSARGICGASTWPRVRDQGHASFSCISLLSRS